MTYSLHLGDCREVLKALAEASVDSIVCDPPYELTAARPGGRSEATRGRVMGGFMGMRWDATGVATDVDLWAECLRVLKPGGYLLAFSGTRTYHRMTCAIEDAGFEVRDQIGWLYGSGFPKSHNGEWGGTALKPAWEPICMARKPLVGTVEANWLAYGTGALNIDGCRISTAENLNGGAYSEGGRAAPMSGDEREGAALGMFHPGAAAAGEYVQPAGRWPANVIHDGSDEVLAAFPDAPGQMADISTTAPSPKTSGIYGRMNREGEASADSDNEGAVGFKMKPRARRLDEGSAARFFYCAKASREDRNDGIGSVSAPAVGTGATMRQIEDADWPTRNGNHHPTVKPTDLMRYLCRLVTPKDGLVLDPFMGSGSTGKAAMLEGLRFVGIDMTPEYIEIARARIEFAKRQGYQPDLLEAA